MASVALFPLRSDWSYDLRHDPHPTEVTTWCGGQLATRHSGTHFGYVYQGIATLRCASGEFHVPPGMYFAVPGHLQLDAGTGLVITRLDYFGFFHLGGPVEERGRLEYIDGCTDSLLIPPVTWGGPCFNLLYLPPNIRQTPHTHPSLRVGLVVEGAGQCLTGSATIPLEPGRLFIIPAGAMHCFQTQALSLRIVSYHPDSNFGPTHENHPMINRTELAHQRP
jgi:mannose-6-phosphate isomerase-like protein (cupin superfamily)